jgi:hypothetical protein
MPLTVDLLSLVSKWSMGLTRTDSASNLDVIGGLTGTCTMLSRGCNQDRLGGVSRS